MKLLTQGTGRRLVLAVALAAALAVGGLMAVDAGLAVNSGLAVPQHTDALHSSDDGAVDASEDYGVHPGATELATKSGVTTGPQELEGSGVLPCDRSGEVHRLMLDHSTVLNAVSAGRSGSESMIVGVSPEAAQAAGGVEYALGYYGITSSCPLVAEIQELPQGL